MADAPDPLSTVLDILSDNWKGSNTGGHVPSFLKVTSQRELEYLENDASYVLAMRPKSPRRSAGLGWKAKVVREVFDLDVRTRGRGAEQFFLNLKQEVERILDAKRINPSSDFTELFYDGDGWNDLSSKGAWFWRATLKVELVNYNKSV